MEIVKLGENLTTILSKAFFNCVSLKSITIPKSIKTIEKDAFLGCKDLKAYYEGTKNEWEMLKIKCEDFSKIIFKE